MQTTVSFPGLGIGEFTMDRAAFHITENWAVYWYAIFIVCGMIGAFIHAYIRVKQEGIREDDILDVGLWTIFVGVIGARLYYVLFDFMDRPDHYQSFTDVIAIWNGGLAIYGGIIAGATAIAVVCAMKKINTLKVMDCIAPGVMLAQAMGRWGNFVNGEAHGGVVSEGHPLYFLRMGLYEGGRMQYFHPTFLYESLWNLAGFALITVFYRKKKFNGQILCAYAAWYGFGRMFIEGLRTDSLWWGPFRVSQLIGAICFIVGTACLIAGLILSKKGMLDKWLTVRWAGTVRLTVESAEGELDSAEDYTPVFTRALSEKTEKVTDMVDEFPDTPAENTDIPTENTDIPKE